LLSVYRGPDCMPMVVGFTFTIAIIGYHVVSLIHMVYWIQLSVIKFVSLVFSW